MRWEREAAGTTRGVLPLPATGYDWVMRLYTGTGDDGTTGLGGGGGRTSKASPRMAALGDVDELNAAVALALAAAVSANDQLPPSRCGFSCDLSISETLTVLQRQLFELGAELAAPADSAPESKTGKTGRVGDEDIAQLEGWIDRAVQQLPAQKSFVLPGGTELSARLHLARAIARRAERSIVRLAESERAAGRSPVNPSCLTFMNRVSDLLFAFARLANHAAGVGDVPWKPRRAADQR